MSHLRSLALQDSPGRPMPGLRYRRHLKNFPGQARAVPAEAEVRPEFGPAEQHVARATVRPGKVICDLLQSEPADYESNG
jgi:hypothetical protein